MLAMNGSAGKQHQELLTLPSCAYSSKSHSAPGSAPGTQPLICRRFDQMAHAGCDLRSPGDSAKIPALPEEMETLDDDGFAPFAVLLCRLEISQKLFFTHVSCAGARTVSLQYIQDSFSSLTDTSHEKISTATARHQKN